MMRIRLSNSNSFTSLTHFSRLKVSLAYTFTEDSIDSPKSVEL
jgi:hypothetical protein